MLYAIKVAWHMLVTTPRYLVCGEGLRQSVWIAWMFRPLSKREIARSERVKALLNL